MSSASGRSFAQVKTSIARAALAYPDHVHDCNGAGEGRHHDRARSAARDLGPELGEVEHEKVEVRGGTQEARPHEQPADLESDQRAEGDARIQIDAAMFAEPARDLREAERDEPDATAAASAASGLKLPAVAARMAGRPKMPLPITPLMTAAVRSKRPIARTKPESPVASRFFKA